MLLGVLVSEGALVTVAAAGLRAAAMIVAGLLLLSASCLTSCSPIPLEQPVTSTDLHKLVLMFPHRVQG